MRIFSKLTKIRTQFIYHRQLRNRNTCLPERLHFSVVKAIWKVVIASAAAIFPVPDEPTTIFEAYQQADCRGRWPTTMLSLKRLLLTDRSRCSPRVSLPHEGPYEFVYAVASNNTLLYVRSFSACTYHHFHTRF